MRILSIGTLITHSIERTRLILFKPFSLKKWLCLLFIAWLSGALGGGRGFGGNYNDVVRRQAEAAQIQLVGVQGPALMQKPVLAKSASSALFVAGLIVLIAVLLFVGLMLIMSWLGARFKFVWFNAIVNNDASIVEPFKIYRREGNSLFLFFMVFLSLFIVFLSLIGIWVFAIGIVSGVFTSEVDWSVMNVISTFFIPAVVLLVGILVAMVLGVYVDNFIVPIMAIDKCRFKPAWRRFVALFKENSGDFILYIFVLMGLGIVCAIIVFFAVLMCLVGLALAALMLFGIPYLLLVVLLKTKVLFMILAVLLAIPFIAVAILLLTSINLPFAVFFRSFSLYFLSSLNVGYMPLQLTTVNGQT